MLQEIVRNEGSRLDAIFAMSALNNRLTHPHLRRKHAVSVDLHRKLVDATNEWARRAEDALNGQQFWINRCSKFEGDLTLTRQKLDALVGAQLRRRRKGVKK